MRILTHEAGRTLGKLPGNYVTLEHTDLAQADSQVQNDCAAIMAQQLRTMLPAHLSGAPALVVGLGNKNITPDALGPCAAGRIFVTRHLIENCSITQIDGVPLNLSLIHIFQHVFPKTQFYYTVLYQRMQIRKKSGDKHNRLSPFFVERKINPPTHAQPSVPAHGDWLLQGGQPPCRF